MQVNAAGTVSDSLRRRMRRSSLSWVAAGLAVVPGFALAQTPASPASVVDVRTGDTFSGIAARFTGDPRLWRTLYDPKRSGLPNPDLIMVGTQLELVKNADGTSYLRVVGRGEARPAAPSAAAAPAPALAAAPAAKPAAVPVAPAPAPAVPAAAREGGSDALVVGVLPNIAAAALLAQYEPMKRYLERSNGRPVRIVTAAGFKPFFDSTMRGDYDIAVTASHFARVGQLDAGLAAIAIFEPRIRALFVGPAERPINGAEDVRGKALAFANPQSLVAMYAVKWLGENNLQAGKDYRIIPARTDLGVGRLMLSGEAAAAVMSNGEFRQVPQEEAARLKIVHEIARIPNFVVLAHPRLGAELTAKLRAQLKAFPSDKEDGAAFTRATGVTTIVDADDAQMRELDPHVDLTRKAMGVAK